MDTNLMRTVRDLTVKVEAVSGKKVKLVEKRGLATPVSVKLANENVPVHTFYIDRSQSAALYHAIAHECVHILRLYEAPPEKRIVPMSTSQMRFAALKDIEPDLIKLRSEYAIEKVASMSHFWFNSIVRQLTNYPLDVAIEQWLYKFYPEIRPVQMDVLKKKLEDATGVLSDEVKALTPEKIYVASCTMHYAYFDILGRYLEIDLLGAFQNVQEAEEGRKLASLTLDRKKDDYETDVEMIQLWANFLGFENWFAWTNVNAVTTDVAE